ncbi:Retrovirus-related Pol polyprotein from transposon TNT 1-94 [Araneus ventricosus]|uniref:Retrovirus-related Pol polyprotein from transposon TNT 1-94 n=1 Tax=Araneus ventricosus TaxID=182803 RepID=A0A4Y2EQ81_ARAVE|nr:Retrovirus-related Pol polyprotein from transposon TNT 1-94 [Araneus ventricosus]
MGYRLLDPVTNHVVVSRNVQFHEEKKKCISMQDGFSIEGKDPAKEVVIPDLSDAESKSLEESYEENTRQTRNVKLPAKLNDYFVYEANVTTLDSVSFEDIETLRKEEHILWRKAMNEEMGSLKKNEVWKLVEFPKDEKPMSCKWVLRIKRNNLYKARLVARDFEQKPGIDYFETYAPVISMLSLRLVLAIIIQKNLEIYALDVKTAFLNGEFSTKQSTWSNQLVTMTAVVEYASFLPR